VFCVAVGAVASLWSAMHSWDRALVVSVVRWSDREAHGRQDSFTLTGYTRSSCRLNSIASRRVKAVTKVGLRGVSPSHIHDGCLYALVRPRPGD
jgi:hypothetical protein